jgi:tagaturonate epimerase
MKLLPRFSFGVGDRFGMQGEAQLRAFVRAREAGIDLTPVWNKSEREHALIGTSPADVRAEADRAVEALSWPGEYFCDADHIHRGCVERYLEACDFFTIDVAEALAKGREAAAAEAGRIFRTIAEARGERPFAVEVSVDETPDPQTGDDLYEMLRLLAKEGVPVQTIAPRFPGRFNKGVEYAGDPAEFGACFESMLDAVRRAVEEFDLPGTLKLSLHSGSDKFAIYPVIGSLLAKTGAGLHVKTAGTTWLEEVAGLAEAGGDSLRLAAEVYEQAYALREALTAPYAQVIDIDPSQLPAPTDVARWNSEQFLAAVVHEPGDDRGNPSMRQLLHVGYKVAAQWGGAFRRAVLAQEDLIGRRVTDNLYRKHMQPLFERNASVDA